MKIPETTWDKIAAQALALLTAILYLGNTVFGWNFGDAKVTAITGVASAFLTLLTIILYANNSTANAAVDAYIAGAWRMGRGIAPRGALRSGAKDAEVEPTRGQVKAFVERSDA